MLGLINENDTRRKTQWIDMSPKPQKINLRVVKVKVNLHFYEYKYEMTLQERLNGSTCHTHLQD